MICSETPNADFKKCTNNLCVGFFCPECFDELDNSCPFCKLMLEYRNTGDESFEVDSSDEDDDANSMNRNFNNNDDDVERGDDAEIGKSESEIESEEDLDFDYQNEKVNEVLVENSLVETFDEIKRRNALRRKLVSEEIFPKTRDRSGENSKKKVLFKMNRRKTKRVINNKLYELYQVLDNNVVMFDLTERKYRSAISDVFLEDYDLYDEIAETILDTIVENISLDEYFDIDEIYKSSFYESLDSVDDEVTIFKSKNRKYENVNAYGADSHSEAESEDNSEN
jgi:hypothetical protein